MIAVVDGFVHPRHPQQNVDVIINDKVLDRWRFIYGKTIQERQLTIPEEIANRQFPLQINFKMLNPVSRFELGLSKQDKRQLGIKLLTMRLEAISGSNDNN